jgi:hypothetical protein
MASLFVLFGLCQLVIGSSSSLRFRSVSDTYTIAPTSPHPATLRPRAMAYEDLEQQFPFLKFDRPISTTTTASTSAGDPFAHGWDFSKL